MLKQQSVIVGNFIVVVLVKKKIDRPLFIRLKGSKAGYKVLSTGSTRRGTNDSNYNFLCITPCL